MEELYEQATEYIDNTNNLSNIQLLSINVSKEIYKDSGLKSYVEFKKVTGVGIERRISNKLKCPSLLETKQLILITDKLGLDINKYLNMFGIKKIYTYQEAYRVATYSSSLNDYVSEQYNYEYGITIENGKIRAAIVTFTYIYAIGEDDVQYFVQSESTLDFYYNNGLCSEYNGTKFTV